MTPENKAKDITSHVLNINIADGTKGLGMLSKHNEKHADIPNIYNCCCEIALEAMQWKDEYYKKLLDLLVESGADADIITNYIKNCIEL